MSALTAHVEVTALRKLGVLDFLSAFALAFGLSACSGANEGKRTPADASVDAGYSSRADAGSFGGADSGPMSVAADGGVTRDAGSSVSADAGSDAALGCGSTNHVSGSRVKMRVAVTDEGDIYWQGFRDTKLDIDCSYATVTSDESRCLPTSLYAPVPEAFADVNYYSSVYYTDERCTEAVYNLRTSCPQDYVLTPELTDVPACAEIKFRLYKRGPQYMATSQLYGRSAGACVPATPAADARLYQVGAEQDLSIYAKGSPGQWASAGGIAMHGHLGVDGSHEARSFWDSTRNQACSIMRLEDGNLHCVAAVLTQSTFADDACARPLASVDTRCDREPTPYAFAKSGTVCETYALYRVLDPYTGSVYGRSPCTQYSPTLASGFQLHTTERADPAEIQELTEVQDATDKGRLQRVHYRNKGGACLLSGMYDHDLDTRCRFNVASDGELRCLPIDLNLVIDGFSDAACKVESKLVYADGCGKLAGRFAIVQAPDGCSSKRHVYNVLPEPISANDVPTTYYRAADGSCLKRPFAPGTYFKVGEEVMPAKMMRATIELR